MKCALLSDRVISLSLRFRCLVSRTRNVSFVVLEFVFCQNISTFVFFLRRYNFREVLAFSTSFFHLVRFLMQSFQFVIFILVISLFTSSSHLFLGLSNDLVSAGDHSYTFFLPCCYLAYDVRVRTKLIFVL